jgi:hypothetical protein
MPCIAHIGHLVRRTTDTEPTETDQQQNRAAGIQTSRSSRDRGSGGLALHGFPVPPAEGRVSPPSPMVLSNAAISASEDIREGDHSSTMALLEEQEINHSVCVIAARRDAPSFSCAIDAIHPHDVASN